MLANKVVTVCGSGVARDCSAAAAGPGTPLRAGAGPDVERLRRSRPSDQILTAWIAKEVLRALCTTAAAAAGHRHDITARVGNLYTWWPNANIPEITTLAKTIATSWPARGVFLTAGLINTHTDGEVAQAAITRCPDPVWTVELSSW